MTELLVTVLAIATIRCALTWRARRLEPTFWDEVDR